jgi:DUF917 family protein
MNSAAIRTEASVIPLPALTRVDEADLPAIALGAAFLGTGGGGDPNIGRMLLTGIIRKHGPVRVIAPEALTEGDFGISVGGVGSPAVIVERLPTVGEAERAFDALQRHLGRKATVVIPCEMGGFNSMVAMFIAAQRGLPVVDGDGMGRAFPEMQMDSFSARGHNVSPIAIANDAGVCALLEALDSRQAETLARSLVVALGGSVTAAFYGLSGIEVRDGIVTHTLSIAHAIGAAILRGRRSGDPYTELFSCLSRSRHYRHHAVIGEGRVVDVQRRIQGGFTIGSCRIESGGFGHADARASTEVVFRNEFLVARSNGATLAIVPDLIVVLDAETAEPITTERLKYGQRVKVVAMSAAACMRTPAALALFGPDKFGIDEPFVPIETRFPVLAKEANP